MDPWNATPQPPEPLPAPDVCFSHRWRAATKALSTSQTRYRHTLAFLSEEHQEQEVEAQRCERLPLDAAFKPQRGQSADEQASGFSAGKIPDAPGFLGDPEAADEPPPRCRRRAGTAAGHTPRTPEQEPLPEPPKTQPVLNPTKRSRTSQLVGAEQVVSPVPTRTVSAAVMLAGRRRSEAASQRGSSGVACQCVLTVMEASPLVEAQMLCCPAAVPQMAASATGTCPL